MSRQKRDRWRANLRSLEVINKDNVTDEDIKFLKENYTSVGGLLPSGFNGGAFFTPTNVAKFIVEALKIKDNSKVLEPSCGSGVFLEFVPPSCEITGIELDQVSAKVAQLIYPNAEIIQGSAFDYIRYNYYDYVVGNPPFGEKIEVEGNLDFETLRYQKKNNKSTGKSEFAFVELAIRSTKPGGYIALISPKNLSFSDQAAKIRKYIYDNCWIIANIKLPPETFQHVGTSVSTQILILRKVTPNAKKVKSVRYSAEFFEGQQPIFFAEIRDVWSDEQFELLLEYFTQDDFLNRENLYPHEPSWVSKGDVTLCPFSDKSVGRKIAFNSAYDEKELLVWNEYTLGSGEGRTWDFYWQDEIVEEYYDEIQRNHQ